MPALKDLVCHVQWAETSCPFPEYGTSYGDGLVETYIAVPGHPQVFNIHLSSRKFISDGLAMAVFIDGRYQCNRNRVNLEPERDGLPEDRSRIDFLVRQNEKPLGDGTYMGREWRFDDYNLVTQLPQGTDESHFHHLGSIEVLVLRCRAANPGERAASTSSSGEHSDIMIQPKRVVTESATTAKNSSKESSTTKVVEDTGTSVEAEETLGGFAADMFDGPADELSFRPLPGDAPYDTHYAYWHHPNRHEHHYGPQQGPHYSSNHALPTASYEDMRRSRSSYRNSPPPAAYGRARSPPPRAERHVHFDYGDWHHPRHPEYDTRYDRQPHNLWEGVHRPEYTRERPGYHYRDHRSGHNPYADYFSHRERSEPPYDTDRRTYAGHSEPRDSYESYRPRSPPPVLYQPPPHLPSSFTMPPAAHLHPPSAGPPEQYGHAQPPFVAPQIPVANPDASVPPAVPPKLPLQQTYLLQHRPHAPQYAPIGIPPPAGVTVPHAVPPFPGPHGVWYTYPPPGNQSLFHAQGPNFNNEHNGQPGKKANINGGPGQTQGDSNTGNSGNTDSNNNVSGQNATAGNTSDADWLKGTDNNTGNNANNDNGWPSENKQNGDSNDNKTPDADWPPADNGNNSGNIDSGNDNNGWDSNNNASNNNNGNQDWKNEDSGNGGWDNNNNTSNDNNDKNNNGYQNWANDSWNQNNSNQNGAGNQQGSGTQQNSQSWSGGNNQSNGWDNNQNTNPTPNNQQDTWNNTQNDNREAYPQHAHIGIQPNGRVLYGPYGPYYGAKSRAQQGPPPDAEEEPRYDVPQAIAQTLGVTKQVQPGPGYLYVKKRSAPVYIDSLEEPYAKFVFKYRTKDQLKTEIGVDVAGEPSGDEEVNMLKGMDKAELIQLVLRAKGALGGNIPEPPPKITPSMQYGFEQIPVPAPDVSFLHYHLPPPRNVLNNAGLGIRFSSGNNSAGNNANQSNPSNGGANGWQENGNNSNNQQNGGGWQDNNDDWVRGCDGQQERKPRLMSQQLRNFSIQSQGTVRHYPQNPQSRRPSGISQKTIPSQGSGRGGGASTSKSMADPLPPPPIAYGNFGTTGGGQTTFDNGISGAGPRPSTPPPRPMTPVNENQPGVFGEWLDEENAGAANPQPANEPRGGW